MFKRLVSTLLLFAALLAAPCLAAPCLAAPCLAGQAGSGPAAPFVSIIQLIAAPEQFHGKRVSVIGFANIEFEGNAVYLTESDWRYMITANGLWLAFDLNVVDVRSAEAFNGKPVIIEGIFDQESKGHMGLWSGTLKGVTRYEPAAQWRE